MNCSMCDHDLSAEENPVTVVIEGHPGPQYFCHADDHDCLSHFNQAGLYGWPVDSEAPEDGTPNVPNVDRRLTGEIPAMEPSEFQRRMADRVAEIQSLFPGMKIVLGNTAPDPTEGEPS